MEGDDIMEARHPDRHHVISDGGDSTHTQSVWQ